MDPFSVSATIVKPVGEASRIKERIEGSQKQIDEHLAKIVVELNQTEPDKGLIQHWKKEVAGWTKTIARLEKRLENRRRRGR